MRSRLSWREIPVESHAMPADGSTQIPIKSPEDALEAHFGFRKFLDGQAQVVSAIVSGRDALVVMPTGGGKSLCYQLPALVMEGVTLVVSPLIALMKDQVDGLTAKGIQATLINSTLSWKEQQERIAGMRRGEYKLVYVAPERFRSQAFVSALREDVEIALFAIDEAHCLSQWGHDFRPDYLRLGKSLAELGRPQTAAFTATATPEVRADILKHLALRDPFECVRGFSRPNLSLAVTQTEKTQHKFDRLKAIIDAHKTGIVYCATRKKVEQVAEMLHSWKVSSVAYHGGMDDGQRSETQNAFLRKERDVVVATNAFGMGIDRADVRFVVHFEVPGSVEAYYQEAGRAGRDGEPAVCELLFNYADTRTQEFFIEGNNPGLKVIQDVYRALGEWADDAGEVRRSINDLADRISAKNTMAVSSAISHLVRAGHLERFDIPGERVRGTRLTQPDVTAENLEIDQESLLEKERRDREKLKAMVEFSYCDECRQQWILGYFGEKNTEPCGNCDSCLQGGSEALRAPSEEEAVIVRKALSGVARMSRRAGTGWTGRFGRGRVVQMLLGSRSQEVLNARLDELSTYGILKQYGSAYLNGLFREMLKAGLLETSHGDYPLVTLTERGDAAMRGEAEIKMRWPQMSARQGTKASPVTGGAEPEALQELGFDDELFQRLKKKRNTLAKEAGNVPAYVIFSNATLEFFTRLRPRTMEAGKRIRGVGEVKAERYLEDFLEVIREFEEEHGNAPVASAVESAQ